MIYMPFGELVVPEARYSSVLKGTYALVVIL